MVKLRYLNVDPIHTLKIFIVPAKIKQFVTTIKDRKYGVTKLPEKKYRKHDLEI